MSGRSNSFPPSSTGSVLVQADGSGPLAPYCSYYGFSEVAPTPIRRREGPGADIVVLVSFGEPWWINGERVMSFAAGLHEQQVTTEHRGRSFAIQLNVAPPLARLVFGLPLYTLANRVVPLDEVLGGADLAERVHAAGAWPERFGVLDALLRRRLADARLPDAGVWWAWQRLKEFRGRVAIGALAAELGWSRKRIVARFRDEVGVAPKTYARLLRFDRARSLAEAAAVPDWSWIAHACGYYDQSHLIHDFRAISGRTPETFFQDAVAASA